MQINLVQCAKMQRSIVQNILMYLFVLCHTVGRFRLLL